MRYQDVFVPGGFPRHTYNPRIALGLEGMVRESTENLCKLVTVTGQTKSGKTVLVRKVLPREEALWIDGGTVSHEDDFWDVIIDQLSLFQGSSEGRSSEVSGTLGAAAKAQANFIIAKGEGEVTAEIGTNRGTTREVSQTVSSRVRALAGLAAARIPLVVDDFHYLPRDLQGSIIRALKPLIFDGFPVVIIAIPHRRYDAVKVEKEMTGRILPVEIPVWSAEELQFISDTGFGLLAFSVPHDMNARLADEAIGSPHLMQDFCRGLCRLLQIEPAPAQTELFVERGHVDHVFKEVAETIGRPIFEKLARGPRQRSDRLQRGLKDGRSVDIYELVLLALAKLRPGLVSIEYEELRAAIRDVSSSQVPQLHEVARVLKHMATIAATDQSSTPVIDFEEDDKKLHITDPFFAFYLRWGDLT